MTVIFLKAFGDFDIMYTKETLVHSEKKDVEALKKEFCAERGITGFEGQPYEKLYDLSDEFEFFLKEYHGFKTLKGTEIYFCT